MKSNNGMTLVSLIIYIIVLMIVIGIISMFTRFFYKDTDNIVISKSTYEQYARLLTYLTSSVNANNLESIKVKNSQKELCITMKDNSMHRFLEDNKKIFYIEMKDENIEKNVIICNNVDELNFIIEDSYITMNLKINNQEYFNIFSM